MSVKIKASCKKCTWSGEICVHIDGDFYFCPNCNYPELLNIEELVSIIPTAKLEAYEELVELLFSYKGLLGDKIQQALARVKEAKCHQE
jgi:hypothetical protein